MRALPTLALCCGALLITACGIKGPLTLPAAPQHAAPPQAVATPGSDDINKAEPRQNAPQ